MNPANKTDISQLLSLDGSKTIDLLNSINPIYEAFDYSSQTGFTEAELTEYEYKEIRRFGWK